MKELLQQALNFIKIAEQRNYYDRSVEQQLIAALEAELAKPEQEPITWVTLNKLAQSIVEEKFLFKRFIDGTPLENDIACWMTDFALDYTSPPRKEWQGLTVEDQADVLDRKWWDFEDSFDVEGFMRLIEAKLKEKNHE